MVTIEYTVHSCTVVPVSVKATIKDREIDATVNGLVIELLQEDHGHTFRLAPGSDDELAAMREAFAPGKRVRLELTPEG